MNSMEPPKKCRACGGAAEFVYFEKGGIITTSDRQRDTKRGYVRCSCCGISQSRVYRKITEAVISWNARMTDVRHT